MNILKTIFGSRNDRVIRRMRKVADRINALEPGIAALGGSSYRLAIGLFQVLRENDNLVTFLTKKTGEAKMN